MDGLGVGRGLGGLVEKELVIIFVFLMGGGIGVTWVLFRVAGLMEGGGGMRKRASSASDSGRVVGLE